MEFFHANVIFFKLFLITCLLQVSSGAPNIPYTTIYVDQSGFGNFNTIQAAIDHIPSNNIGWTHVYVKAGIYTEQVIIPKDKPFIFIEGQGYDKTRVQWNSTGIGTATFVSNADNIVVKTIAFINTYNYPPGSNNNDRTQAIAAMVNGDQSSFYGVAFLGVQDTLFDHRGRHYFESCIIEGAVDFIFGLGQSYYERCTLFINLAFSNVSDGYITAHGRENANDKTGFVFNHCQIMGNGNAYLGRSWRPYSRVIFLNTYMQNVIDPTGWDPWFAKGHEENLVFSEYNCCGLGANNPQRVTWEHRLTKEEVDEYGSISFVDGQFWILNQLAENAHLVISKPNIESGSRRKETHNMQIYQFLVVYVLFFIYINN